MLDSRPFQQLGCSIQATLFHACLTADDLRALGAWSDRPGRAGYSPHVWCRASLLRACRRDADLARTVADRLDLQFLDTIVRVRTLDEGDLEETVHLWVERPEPEALPGLLWALVTDPRDEVHALGHRLGHEAVTVAFRTLLDDPTPLPRTASTRDPHAG